MTKNVTQTLSLQTVRGWGGAVTIKQNIFVMAVESHHNCLWRDRLVQLCLLLGSDGMDGMLVQ